MKTRSGRIPGWLIELPVVALSLAAFLALTFYQIDLPGLHTDEALEVVPAVQLVRGQEVECFKDVCIDLLGVRLPVMIYEYIATVNTYMAIPFFAILGINVPALRAMPIFQSAVAMVFLYMLARELYNRRVAAAALLMISVSPSFVFWSRQGVFVTSVTIPISLAGVWAWLRWWRSGKRGYLYLGSFLFGLGVSAKFLFGWLIAGVGGAFVLLNLDRIVACVRQRSLAPLFPFRALQALPSLPSSPFPPRRHLRWYPWVVAVSLLLIGLLPQIIFNIRTQSTIHYIRENVSTSSYYQIDNTNIAENLRERIKQLRSVLNGETFWYLSIHPYASWRYPSVFLIAVGVAVLSAFGSRRWTLGEMLPTWATVVGTVLPAYAALFFLRLQEPYWYVLSLVIGALASVVVALVRGWRTWAGRCLPAGLGASLSFTLFVYLAWKLAQWKVPWTVYWVSVLGLILAPWLRAREEVRKVLFPVLAVALMLAASVFTPTALWFTHLAILTPWPILAIAAIADLVVRRLGLDQIHLALPHPGPPPMLGEGVTSDRRRAAALSLGWVAVLALVGMLMYDDLEVDLAYHRELRIVGGKGDHTAASYGLVAYLQEQGINDVVAMDMGIQDVVQFLSAGEINPVEIFGYQNRENVDSAFPIRVREQLQNPGTVYVFHVTYPIFQNRWEAFQAIVAGEGKRWVEEQIIYDWSAIPIFRLVRVTS